MHLHETGNSKSSCGNGEFPFQHGNLKHTTSRFHMGITKWKGLAANPNMEIGFKT
jgi:hypothetical protein